MKINKHMHGNNIKNMMVYNIWISLHLECSHDNNMKNMPYQHVDVLPVYRVLYFVYYVYLLFPFCKTVCFIYKC